MKSSFGVEEEEARRRTRLLHEITQWLTQHLKGLGHSMSQIGPILKDEIRRMRDMDYQAMKLMLTIKKLKAFNTKVKEKVYKFRGKNEKKKEEEKEESVNGDGVEEGGIFSTLLRGWLDRDGERKDAHSRRVMNTIELITAEEITLRLEETDVLRVSSCVTEEMLDDSFRRQDSF